MAPDARFKIGSVTKTFVAAVVLQLVDEHVLALTDPISEWLPTFPIGAVTVDCDGLWQTWLSDELSER